VPRHPLLAARSRQKLKRREVEIDVGQDVLLSTVNFKLAHPGTRKLLPKWVGPFKVIERIGKVAYKVELPPNLKMHNVFHVQLLKKYRDNGKVLSRDMASVSRSLGRSRMMVFVNSGTHTFQ
jgi:hypothetical protein